ncbi:hypothetical protein [Cuniculiplasma sp. SKW4]|uniref:hypothetical protein n=1 Tax=Cuniculiplasma sp. SKW4 TaxID=3400171 RepID=UPI003FD515C4
MHETDFLKRILNDNSYRESEDIVIDRIIEMLRRGFSEDKIRHTLRLNVESKYDLIEFAKVRIKIKDKFTRGNRLWMDKYSASYSTPELSGIYRAKRLSGKNILDIGSGAGMQSIFFSKYSRTTGIERDTRRYLMSQINAEIYQSKARFLFSDFNNLKTNDLNFDTVFSDPLRASSTNERTLEALEPNPIMILEKFHAYNPQFVFDLPPMIGKEKLNKMQGELEYMSINGSIHRLTNYGNGDRIYSAVMLPQERRYYSRNLDKYVKNGAWSEILFIPDPSLFYSEIEDQYCRDNSMHLVQREKRKSIYAANMLFDEPMGEFFEVVKISDYENIINYLKESNFGRVFLRYDSKDYYKEKMEIERNLFGNETCYIFKIGNEYALCKKIQP